MTTTPKPPRRTVSGENKFVLDFRRKLESLDEGATAALVEAEKKVEEAVRSTSEPPATNEEGAPDPEPGEKDDTNDG